MLKRYVTVFAAGLVAAAAAAAPASAQDGALAARCQQEPSEDRRTVCLAVSQAAESAQPRIGILLSGGNPVLGSMGAGGGGIRLPGIPNVDLTARASLVFVPLPDVLAEQGGGTAGRAAGQLDVPAPALAFDGAVGVFPGIGVSPGLGGIGSVDVLVSGSWLPFRTFGTEGFEAESPDLAWGAGARLGLLRESFVAPGVAVSLMRHRVGNVAFGDVCRGQEFVFPMPPDESECVGPGDAGEFSFDLTAWSTRAVVGKRLLGVGLAGGVGYDRYSSDVAYGFRYADIAPNTSRIVRPVPVAVSSSRWSAFGNVSYQFLLASLALEAGWQQGGSPIPGFQGGNFDPGGGAFFGSAGLRLAF